MEQIKFKAISLLDGSWVFGDVIHRGKHTFIFEYDQEVHDELIGNPVEEFLNFIPVDPDTVCSSVPDTFDKNGKQIFVGDYYQQGGFNVICQFLPEILMYEFVLEDDVHEDEFRYKSLTHETKGIEGIKIVGNIWDNE